MAPATYQTIKLGKGKHRTPKEGACVMELASMLAGEAFSDHPVSVCPVIGSFLRAYNDSIDDRRRQDLYAYASKVVGSRSTTEVERARVARIVAWTAELHPRRRRWLGRLWRFGALGYGSEGDVVGPRAVRKISRHDDQTHARVLSLIDELLEIGAPGDLPPAVPIAGTRAPRATEFV